MNTIETKHSEGALTALIAMQAEQITNQNKIVHELVQERDFLRGEVEALRADALRWKAAAEHWYGEYRNAACGDVDYPTLGALDAWYAKTFTPIYDAAIAAKED